MSDTEKVDEGFLHFSAEERWLVFSLTGFHVFYPDCNQSDKGRNCIAKYKAYHYLFWGVCQHLYKWGILMCVSPGSLSAGPRWWKHEEVQVNGVSLMWPVTCLCLYTCICGSLSLAVTLKKEKEQKTCPVSVISLNGAALPLCTTTMNKTRRIWFKCRPEDQIKLV